jgi:hypothetical protein
MGRDDLRDAVVEVLGDAERGVLIVDETGFLKKSVRSAGVGWQLRNSRSDRELSGRRVLAYASDRGRALIDRELYLPKDWTDDREPCRETARSCQRPGPAGGCPHATPPRLRPTSHLPSSGAHRASSSRDPPELVLGPSASRRIPAQADSQAAPTTSADFVSRTIRANWARSKPPRLDRIS